MKLIALAQRLLRDLKEKDLASLTADARLELVDAINAGLGRMHIHAPSHSKVTAGAITLAAPTNVTLTLTNGSNDFTGHLATSDDIFSTIIIEGDAAQNQLTGDGLLYPYSGPTGEHAAIIYHDAALLPAEVESLIGDPEDIDRGRILTNDPGQSFRHLGDGRLRDRRIDFPTTYRVEENAANVDSTEPAVFRVNTLPPGMVRLATKVSKAPARVNFAALLDGSASVPMRQELIEPFLMPIARGILSSSSLWRNEEQRAKAASEGEAAEGRFAIFAPRHLSTPSNKAFTPRGY